MSFETFKESKKAAPIAPLLSSASILAQMEALSREGKPAVAALDCALAGKIELSHTERQYVGRWVRDVLAPLGWRPLHQRRLSAGKVFSSGSVYARRPSDDPAASTAIPAALLPVHARATYARDLVRAFSTVEYATKDYLRDKRVETDREARR